MNQNVNQAENEEITAIGELAISLGLTTRTLRYWEEVGIIESVQRADGASRGYTPYTVRRIKFIMRLKELGLTIKEMQDLYIAYGEAKETERMIPRLVEILDEHVNLIDGKMANLASLRKEIIDYRKRLAVKFAESVASKSAPSTEMG